MAVISVVKLSEASNQHRIDSEFYQPDFLTIAKQLKSGRFDTKPLIRVSKRIDVGFVSSMKDEFVNEGIPLLRTQNVKEFFIDLDADLVFIRKEFHEKLNKTQIFPGYVLLARSGSIGDACVVPKDFPEANSADIITIEPKSPIIPEYLTTFLNCKYGRLQVLRLVSGGVQGHINLGSLEKVEIPLLLPSFQKKIREMVDNIHAKFSESKSLYSQAETILLSELGLQNFKPKDKLFYKVSLSETSRAHRIDAEYFNPSYEEVINKIKNYKNGYGKLLTFAENIKPKFEPQKFPQKTFSYVELADINASIGVIQSSTNITGEEAPSRAKRILKKNDVIVSSVEGSLEKVALVDEQFEGSLASTGFFQFRPKDILPEVLLILSKSPIIQNQLKKECAGTILTAVPKEALRKLIIPNLPKQTQQKIAKLVQESHKSRRKAKQLLEEVKKKVEDAIKKQK